MDVEAVSSSTSSLKESCTTESMASDRCQSCKLKMTTKTSGVVCPHPLSRLPMPTPIPSLSSLDSLQLPSSTSSDTVDSQTTSCPASISPTVEVFKDTKWIHFTAERCLSVDFPLIRALPSTHKLTFNNCKGIPKVIQHVLHTYGFTEAKSSVLPTITWSGSPIHVDDLRHFEGHQKINHFLRIETITRKDRLCENIQRMQLLKGLRHFNIIPKTFVLPREISEFENTLEKAGGTWIIKPACLSRGRGISIINNPCKLMVKEPMVVSRYIEDPFCINGLKFDLRLYVLVTSFDPLRIYLFEEGLGRFASVPYQKDSSNIQNLSMHLTNYSFNKHHSDYITSDDPIKDNVGNKWSSSAVFRYLREQGHDVNKLLMSIEDVIIKTIIAGEMPVCSASLRYQQYHGNCFELLGFDILLDTNLKPWVLEVNLCPSLNCDTPLDLRIKSKLVADTFSLVGVSLPHNSHQSNSKTKAHTRYSNTAAADGYHKMRIGSKFEETSVLVQTKAEHRRRGGFVRIFPTNNTWELYSSFLENRTKQNYLLHRNLFPENGRIKWPPSSVGASLNVSLRLKMCTRPNTHKCNGLNPLQRIELYVRKLTLGCDPLISHQDIDSFAVEGTATAIEKTSSEHLHIKCVVSVYLRKLSVYLSSLDLNELSSNCDIHINKLMNAIIRFLNCAVLSSVVIPDHFLPISIKFRMVLQQLKDFILFYNNNKALCNDGMSEFSSSDSMMDLEEIILTQKSKEIFFQRIVELVKCIRNLRTAANTCGGCSSTKTEDFSSTTSTNANSKPAKTNMKNDIHSKQIPKTIRKKCRKSTNIKSSAGTRGSSYPRRCKTATLLRPHSVSPVPVTLHLSGSRRGFETEDDVDTELNGLCDIPYKSLPCKLQSGLSLNSVDWLSDDTNKVVLAALQRLSDRQLMRRVNSTRPLLD